MIGPEMVSLFVQDSFRFAHETLRSVGIKELVLV